MGNSDIELKYFSEINLSDEFFDSLKKSYPGFDNWYNKKAMTNCMAYVQYSADKKVQAFLYLKDESSENLKDIFPDKPQCRRLKVGTFKINSHGTILSERFIKKIFDSAIVSDFEEIYVTVFPEHDKLISILQQYGFKTFTTKSNGEYVLVKDMKHITGNIIFDYPLLTLSNRRKFLLSIYPKYHTKLFPDSILNNEENYKYDLVKDVSYTNSIHKIYICFMKDVVNLRRGDLVCIYRTNDNMGPAYYRSVVTSICQVEEVKTKTMFSDIKDYLQYTKKYSIFEEQELLEWYKRKELCVIKMTYNIAFNKKVTRDICLIVLEYQQLHIGAFCL